MNEYEISICFIVDVDRQRMQWSTQSKNGGIQCSATHLWNGLGPHLNHGPSGKAEYLVKHYWDKFDFKDTTYIHEPQVTEQALSNYIDLMNYVSPAAMSSSVKAMMKQTEQDSAMFQYFSEMMEKYLYDPNSPLRNEEMYIAVLEYLTESSSLSDVEKIRPAIC